MMMMVFGENTAAAVVDVVGVVGYEPSPPHVVLVGSLTFIHFTLLLHSLLLIRWLLTNNPMLVVMIPF
jgi:hypothetical protein